MTQHNTGIPEKSIFHESLVLRCAEQDPNRWIIITAHFMEPEPVHIGIQLAEIFVGECTRLQLVRNTLQFKPTVSRS
jgi:hypothetical protein